MKEYHKIQTVYLRDPATKHRTLLEGQFSLPEFEYLKNSPWEFTEKIDGTNIRVHWDGEQVIIGGRTDRAQIPFDLLMAVGTLLPESKFGPVFDCPVTLYGEGYGAKIQKGGGNYISDGVSFCLFDVLINDNWLDRSNVEDIANKLGLTFAPVMHTCTLLEGVEMCREGITSTFGDFQAEGFVMRPSVELRDRRGNRIISKIKCKDFQR